MAATMSTYKKFLIEREAIYIYWKKKVVRMQFEVCQEKKKQKKKNTSNKSISGMRLVDVFFTALSAPHACALQPWAPGWKTGKSVVL